MARGGVLDRTDRVSVPDDHNYCMLGGRRLGCFGGLVVGLGVVLAVYALLAPWAFHIGGRWTWSTTWSGVGELRDSHGARYGLYVYFYPEMRRGRGGGMHYGPAHPTPDTWLRGTATVCTAQGAKFPFKLSGDVYGAWRDVEGNEIVFDLREQTKEKTARHFQLVGAFHGSDLTMDDRKSMFMYFLPDGKLTPARSYTSPVPEKYARVTLQWGSTSDFDQLCAGLASGAGK